MPKAEWRLFLPNVDRRAPAQARTLIRMLDHVPPVQRIDVYLKADANIGVKRRVSKNACSRVQEACAHNAVKGTGAELRCREEPKQEIV